MVKTKDKVMKLHTAHIVIAAKKKESDDDRIFATEEVIAFNALSLEEARKAAEEYCSKSLHEYKNDTYFPGIKLIADPPDPDLADLIEGELIGYFVRLVQDITMILNPPETTFVVPDETELTYSCMIFSSIEDMETYCFKSSSSRTIKVELYNDVDDYHFAS